MRVRAARRRRRRRAGGGGRSPARTAGTGRAGAPGSRCRPARGPPRSTSGGSAAAGPGARGTGPSRWPPRVLISSPTTTRTRRPRSCAIALRRERGVDPLVVGDRDDVEARRPRSTRSRISATDAVPSDASVWMWRSARPSRSVGSDAAIAVIDRRRDTGVARSAARRSPRPRRGPARSGGRRPTTARGASARIVLEGGGDRGREARPSARGASRPRGSARGSAGLGSGRPRSRRAAADVDRWRRSRWRAGPGRPGSAPGGRRTGPRCPNAVRSRSATRPTDSPARRAREERPAGVGDRHDVDADPAARA